MIVRAAVRPLLISIAFALAVEQTGTAPPAAVASGTSPRVVASSAISSCETARSWFAQQPGSRLVLSLTSDYNQKFARPRKPDNIANYNATPFSNDKASWYKNMKHYTTNVGNGRCISGFYDSAHKTALIFSQNGTGSDLTLTTIVNAPAGFPIHSAPSQTRNGVRLGMTVAQVEAIDGPGTIRSDGRYKRLTYSQDIKKTPKFSIVFYLGFLFVDGKLVAADVGGGV